MEEQPRVGQYCIHRIGGDRYAGIIVAVEKDLIFVRQEGHGEITRCKKNRTSGGYGEQKQVNGRWVYSHAAKYRHLATWHPVEGVASTYLDPSF